MLPLNPGREGGAALGSSVCASVCVRKCVSVCVCVREREMTHLWKGALPAMLGPLALAPCIVGPPEYQGYHNISASCKHSAFCSIGGKHPMANLEGGGFRQKNLGDNLMYNTVMINSGEVGAKSLPLPSPITVKDNRDIRCYRFVGIHIQHETHQLCSLVAVEY